MDSPTIMAKVFTHGLALQHGGTKRLFRIFSFSVPEIKWAGHEGKGLMHPLQQPFLHLILYLYLYVTFFTEA